MFKELIQQSDKPLVVESQALWTALQSLSEYPKKLGVLRHNRNNNRPR